MLVIAIDHEIKEESRCNKNSQKMFDAGFMNTEVLVVTILVGLE